MEWAPDSTGTVVEFNDDATFAFVNRYMEDDAVPQYTVTKTENNGVSIKTDYLTVRLSSGLPGMPYLSESCYVISSH